MLKSFLLAVASFCSLALASDDHGVGKIQTPEIDIIYIDHIVTGRVGDRPVFGKPSKDEDGYYDVWHRANGKNYESTLKYVEEGPNKGKYVAEVNSTRLDKTTLTEKLKIWNVSMEESTLSGSIGKRSFTVETTSDEMAGHHHITPHIKINFDNGDVYEFDLKGGKACMGCVTRLTFAIVSMLYSYGTI